MYQKGKGREPNAVVDTMGLVIASTMTATSVQGRDTTAVVAHACAKALGLATLDTDGGYDGYRRNCANDIEQRHRGHFA